ncbi:TMhelix containing protein [Vibrio phage 1.063.O._10N.261.45.C7]|nr:TMhelix containing protein [Vibrio phage 1.063.O._10N.261.45.C7]
MSWFTDIFSSGTSKLVDSVGSAIDSLVTSDEERLKLKNELNQQVSDFKKTQLSHVENLEKEISTRHKTDMQSDSWLSKNVRPVILMFLTAATVLLSYLTIFADLTELQVTALEGWLPLLQTLLISSYTFYFGGRSYEKAVKIKKGL